MPEKDDKNLNSASDTAAMPPNFNACDSIETEIKTKIILR